MTTEITATMRRSILIAALRDETTWPPGFKWDFRACPTCALGLAHQMLRIAPNPTIQHVGPLLGLPAHIAAEIFAPNDCEGYGVPRTQVTPSMVADKLEAAHRFIAK